MDVHPPHKAITSPGEFFLHLFTITIGLLIAVGIEGAVEHMHHKHLVREAKATLREEIESNSQQITHALDTIHKEQSEIDTDIAVMKRILADPHGKDAHDASLTANYNIIGLRDTAWKTAEATEALTYMSYQDAQNYSDIYGSQDSFIDAQKRQVEDVGRFVGISSTFQDKKDVTAQQADDLIRVLGEWKMHLQWIELNARICDMSYKAFLEGKPAPKALHEDLKG